MPDPANRSPSTISAVLKRTVLKRTVLNRTSVLASALALILAPTAQAGTYDLVSNPPAPIIISEADSSPNISIEIIDVDCADTWGPSEWLVTLIHNSTSPSDVTLQGPPFISFNESLTSVAISLSVTDDAATEIDETFDLVLTADDTQFNCDTGTWNPAQAQYTFPVRITDNDQNGTFRIGDVEVLEGNDGTVAAVFDVTLDAQQQGRLSKTLSVRWQTQSGTAQASSDFVAAQGNLIFDNGEASQEIRIQVQGDVDEEPDERFFVDLVDSSGADIGRSRGVGTILNDDGSIPVVSIDSGSIAEGDEGSTPLQLAASLSQASDVETRVRFTTSDDSARASDGDYQAKQGSIVFAPGETQQQVTLQIHGDTDPEGDESFRVELFDPDGVVLGNSTAVATIVDDDGGSTSPTLSIADATVNEGDEGVTQARVIVSLSTAADQAVQVRFETADGSARAGADYQGSQGTLTFEPGVTQHRLMFQIRGDVDEEPDETFFVRLSEPQGATVERGEGTVTILDDDGNQPSPGLSISDVQVTEGDVGSTVARFQVSLSPQAQSAVSVDFRTVDGTATVGDQDYRATQGRLVFSDGQSSTFIEVQVRGDERRESDELFTVMLENPEGAVLLNAVGRGRILNDDEDDGGNPSSIRFAGIEGGAEGAGPVRVTVERLGSTSLPTRVALATVSGTARAGIDFQQTRERLFWPVGDSTPRRVEIAIIDDTLREGEERFGVLLTQPENAEIVGNSRVAIVITDNDIPMELQLVGDAERTETTRSEIELQVRVAGENDRPVSGIPIQWEAEGQATLAGNGRGISNADGLASQTVRLARTPGPAVVRARVPGTDKAVTIRIRVEGDLDGNRPPGGGSGNVGVAQTLNQSCADAEGQYAQLCSFLFGLDSSSEQEQALDRLTPRGALAQARAALRGPNHQVRNVGARLTALRGGMARQSLGQLAFNIQGDSLSLGPIQQAIVDFVPNDTWARDHVADAITKAADLETGGARGGAASGDQDELSLIDDAESPWGFFTNGRVSFGDAPRLGETAGYEISTEGLSAGIDYRFNDRLVMGAALGYVRSDSDVEQNQGSFELEGLSLSLYSTYYREAFYIDGLLSVGENSYDIERVVELPRPLAGVTRFVATGEPDSDQLAAHLGVGYDLLIGDALTLGGFIRGSWVRSTIEPYVERGALFFDLAYEEQETESLIGEAGLEMSYPFSVSWGVLQPLLRVAFLHEFEDGVQILSARFAIDPTRRTFTIRSEAQDRDYVNLALGVTVTLPRSWASYLQYDTDLERDDLDVYTLSGGFRFQF